MSFQKVFLSVAVITVLSFVLIKNKDGIEFPSFSKNKKPSRDSLHHEQLILRSKEALEYCIEKNFSTQYCFLLHYGMHSGKKRFYLWDFQQGYAVDSGLVSHGCGKSAWSQAHSKTKPIFSNEFESHCSSVGKYKIGERGYSQWGIHVKYLIHGKDSTNSNALERYIVLHSWDAIPEETVYPNGAAESWGCPAVSNEFMNRLDERLKEASKPVLLWIFTE